MEQIMNEIIAIYNTTVGHFGIGVLVLFCIKKYIEYSLNKKMNETIEKLKSEYNKKIHAYDFLLKKEFAYYEKVDCEYADLIVNIQDINYYITKANTIDKKLRKKKSKVLLMKMIKQTKRLKGYSLTAQCYITKEVWHTANEVVMSLQDSFKELYNAYEAFIGDEEINAEVLDDVEKNVLLKVAAANYAVKNRLENMG